MPRPKHIQVIVTHDQHAAILALSQDAGSISAYIIALVQSDAAQRGQPFPVVEKRIDHTAAILDAYERGVPIADIAAQYKCDESYPTQLAKRRGLPPRKP